MTTIQGTAIIRNRGQLTIPDKIRKSVQWASSNGVVNISTTSNEEIIIKPYKKEDKKKVDWDKIWEGIRWARSLKGKRGNLSAFIEKDRERKPSFLKEKHDK